MERRILWIEDDYYAVKGLVRPLEKRGIKVIKATSAIEGMRLAEDPESYDLIIVDLILPLSDTSDPVPPEIEKWRDERYVGVGLIKWLLTDRQVRCPVLVLSVVNDAPATFGLDGMTIAGQLPKRALLPSAVEAAVLDLLEGVDGATVDTH